MGLMQLHTDPRHVVTWRAVVLGVVLATAALVLTLPLRDLLLSTHAPIFYAAVAFAAYYTGLTGAVVTIALSVAFAEIFLSDPPLAPSYRGAPLLRDTLFVLISAGIAVLSDRLQAARDRAQTKAREVEQLVVQLRENAHELEQRATDAEQMAAALEQLNRQAAVQSAAQNRAAQRASRLQRFTATLLDHVGGAAVSRAIVVEGRNAVDAAAALIAVPTDDGYQVLASEGYAEQQFADADSIDIEETPAGAVLRTGEAVFVHDRAEMLQRYPAVVSLLPESSGAWAVLPLQAERRGTGVFALSFDEPSEFTPEDRAFMQLVAQQCAQALERARLHDMELRARVRAEFAERRLSFLADASARLAASLDYHATLTDVADATVPQMADWCMVYLLDNNDVPRLVTAVHEDDAQVAAYRALEAQYPAAAGAAFGVARVFRSAEPEFVEVLTDESLQAAAQDESHLRALRTLNLRSLMAVPVPIADRAVGVITLGMAESGRTFGSSDLRLAQELGRRAGQAVENARLYQATHHASLAKSEFLAVMSHELRTPLNAIIGYSDLIVLGVPEVVPDRARKQVERIRGASSSLLHLVDEVLSFSRIEAGKEEIRISPVDVTAVLRDCVDMVEPLAAAKGLSLDLHPRDEPLKLVSDEKKLRQIITNLLSNAVKFTEEGGILVRAAKQELELHVEVRDTGIGIDPQHLENIFDPFWQVEQSATRRFGGTGLGLGVARKLARLLEGRLEVSSQPGEGSTFTLVLPLHTPGMQKRT